MRVGDIHDEFIKVPKAREAQHKRRINPDGSTWNAVLAAVGRGAELTVSTTR